MSLKPGYRLSVIGYRCFSFLFTCYRLPITVLLFTFLSSCGNGEGDKQIASTNDSLPADIKAINEKINADRNNPDLYFQRAKANFFHKDFEKAIGDMNIVLKIDSTKPDYYIFLSDVYFT